MWDVRIIHAPLDQYRTCKSLTYILLVAWLPLRLLTEQIEMLAIRQCARALHSRPSDLITNRRRPCILIIISILSTRVFAHKPIHALSPPLTDGHARKNSIKKKARCILLACRVSMGRRTCTTTTYVCAHERDSGQGIIFWSLLAGLVHRICRAAGSSYSSDRQWLTKGSTLRRYSPSRPPFILSFTGIAGTKCVCVCRLLEAGEDDEWLSGQYETRSDMA